VLWRTRDPTTSSAVSGGVWGTLVMIMGVVVSANLCVAARRRGLLNYKRGGGEAGVCQVCDVVGFTIPEVDNQICGCSSAMSLHMDWGYGGRVKVCWGVCVCVLQQQGGAEWVAIACTQA
jgi:hypothetical protein